MSMEVSNTYGNYGSDYHANATTQKTETTEKTSRRNVKEYGDYLRNKYECLTPTKTTSVAINPSLMRKAITDKKTAEWLEHNLALIPKCVDKMMAAAEARGSRVISCNISINGYDNISTEMCSVFEADPGTDKIRERTEETIKRRREEKKAEERRQAEKQEKERLEELAAEKRYERAVTVTGTDIKDITSCLVASIRGKARVSNFDIRA